MNGTPQCPRCQSFETESTRGSLFKASFTLFAVACGMVFLGFLLPFFWVAALFALVLTPLAFLGGVFTRKDQHQCKKCRHRFTAG
ncbi:MAG: hypothetical protein ACOYW9_09885 [Deinococcota bacterium]